MLELLILYTLNKNELTMYGLQKFITEYFGEVSKPSHGGLVPALKRLREKNIVSLRKKLSDGGKRYTYYSVKDSFHDFFNEKFMNLNSAVSETVDAFLLETQVRLFTIELLDKSFLAEFKEKISLKLSAFEAEITQKLENPYIELTKLQKNISNIYLSEIGKYKELINNLD